MSDPKVQKLREKFRKMGVQVITEGGEGIAIQGGQRGFPQWKPSKGQSPSQQEEK